MGQTSAERTVRRLFSLADIDVNGERPWDIRINDDGVYPRLLTEGSMGLGESYMDGGWDSDSVDELINRILCAGLEEKVKGSRELTFQVLRNKLINPQSKRRSLEVGRRHYDIGNELYAIMLDDEMNYSCGYWREAQTLDEAQRAKLSLICKKIGLEKGMRVLDIGCGWGAFARHAAKHFGAEVVGVTISREQAALAAERCRDLPIEIRFEDYRDIQDKFDRVVSIGMFEHVGPKNYREYMEVTNRCLEDGGLSMLHTIGANTTSPSMDPWMERYIFPKGKLPSAKEIASAAEGLFVIEDWHSFGTDYERTLLEWYRNFNAGWETLKKSYGERFRRMWNYYLLACAGTFRAREIQLWQVVLSKGGVAGGYRSIR